MSGQDTHDILLCPGQGAQHVGMGKAWAERSASAAETYAEADRVLDMELSRLCFEGPEDRLHRTEFAQAAIFVTSVACHRALAEEGLLRSPAAAAGLSLGEFTALHLAGALDFAGGLRLVRLRGQAMQDAAEAVASGMVALVGAEPDQAEVLCDAARGDDVLVPANFNCPGQIVISGSRDACERAVAIAGEQGLRATPLAVAGAFHSPLMRPAADRLARALDDVQWQAPTIPVVSNVTARPHGDGGHDAGTDGIKTRLVEQLTHPVRWADGMTWMIAHAEGRFVELAPGKVLLGLMRRIDRSVRVTNFAAPPA